MASFGALTFNERGSGNGRDFPVHGARHVFTEYIVPFGEPYLVAVGKGHQDFVVRASGTATQLASLRNAARDGSFDTLTYAGGAIGCSIKEVGNAVKVLDDTDLYFFDLTFARVE